ncbi:sensor domain-containing diguanylate cyclase [Deinococcus multiflagellatus]|uniref:Diguanylate cyclase domain-containing protein n=1 Tax=Deinococcus multiflagellatus TaxID=1656887 RepID=A0ABW1ZGW1_9DEIO
MGLLLMYNTVPVGPGLLLDFRSVVVALAAQRYGILAGLAVALPLAVYRWLLGGAGLGPALLNLVLVAVLAGSNTGWLRRVPWSPDDDLRRQWWVPLRVFAVANLSVFAGFALAQRPLTDALLTYGALTLFSSAGLVVAHSILQGRLRAAQRTSHLEGLAYLDSLTGCANRRRFEEDFAHARPPAYLLMLDLDHFKQVNDSYGHEVGDQVLVIVGATLRRAVRANDGVYRLGGEEFAVVLCECCEDAAFAVAEHILRCVQLEVATRAQLHGESVTVSGGLTP